MCVTLKGARRVGFNVGRFRRYNDCGFSMHADMTQKTKFHRLSLMKKRCIEFQQKWVLTVRAVHVGDGGHHTNKTAKREKREKYCCIS